MPVFKFVKSKIVPDYTPSMQFWSIYSLLYILIHVILTAWRAIFTNITLARFMCHLRLDYASTLADTATIDSNRISHQTYKVVESNG